MRFDELSPTEKIAYKKHTLEDLTKNGMSEREALVNYVFFINPDPIKWLSHRYGMIEEEVTSLKASGLEKYKLNGGTRYNDGIDCSALPMKACKCRRPILPD